MAPMSLPPGFRFHPTDEELVVYYLERKITGRRIELEIIPEVDLYKCEPWDLPDKSFLPSKDNEWYFYSQRDRKYPNGSRTNRATKAGYWKATGKDRTVQSQKRPVGMKKTLVYYRGRAPHGLRTNWVMHEYRLIDSYGTAPPTLKDSYALCRVFKKTTQIPKAREEDMNGNAEKEMAWLSDENVLRDDSSSNIDISQEREAEYEQNFNRDFSKFPSDTSSSDITQGTPIENGATDDLQAPFPASDEANSSANLYLPNVDFSSNLFQDIQMPTCSASSLHYQFHYPPLAVEDFPLINIPETKQSEPETFDEYMNFDKYYTSGGTAMLDEILSLCSYDQDLSIDLSMQNS